MLCAFPPSLAPVPGVGAPRWVVHSPFPGSARGSGSLARAGSMAGPAALGVNGRYVLDLLLK